ncbi:MAG: hypothetical protein IJ439_03680 [Tyzzerella sp.]|nr:hypothetical protein [Tyzzerella sp.]
MKQYKEIKQIAKYIQKIQRLSEQLAERIDVDDIEWNTAHLVSMSKEQLSHLELVADEYYVKQYQGYIEDDFYGWLYYATDVPGQYVKVHFGSY